MDISGGLRMENELFEKAPVPRAYLKLALPVVFSMVLTVIYNMVDTFFIARTGNTDLIAAVSLSAPLFTFMIGIGDIFGLGGCSVISRLFGEKRYEEGRAYSVFCYYGAIITGVIMAVLMLVFRVPILRFLGADDHTMEYALQYYSFLAVGAPFIILSFSPNNILRTEGFSFDSMLGGIIGSCVNIVLDPIFISVFDWGAAGAAAATVLGYICTDIYYTRALICKPKYLSINLKWIRKKIPAIWPILVIGIPAAVTNLTQSFGTALMNRALLPYGNENIAARGIAVKISSIAVMVMIGMAFGGQSLIGYNYGAKNHRRFRKIMKFAFGIESVIAVVLSLLISFAAPVMMRFFVEDPVIIESGTKMLRIMQSSMLALAVVFVSTVTFQATGKAMGALTLSISRQGIIFAAVLAAGSALAGYEGVLWAQPISDVITAVMGAVIFARVLLPEIRTGVKE